LLDHRNKIKHKDSKEVILARKVDEAVTCKGRGNFKVGDDGSKDVRSVGKASGGLTIEATALDSLSRTRR
jgi:hypothetical protein